MDVCIGRILDTINQRRRLYKEDWLVCLCTDHGGTTIDPNEGTGDVPIGEGDCGFHGLDIPEHRTIWMIIEGGSVVPGEIIPPPTIVDIPITIIRHMTGQFSESWNVDGIPVGLATQLAE